jgi:hypothetical protein
MMMKPRHPAIVKRCEATRRSLQTVPPIRIPQWLDEELERELTAPCPLFRTSFLLVENVDVYPGWYNRREDWWKAIHDDAN